MCTGPGVNSPGSCSPPRVLTFRRRLECCVHDEELNSGYSQRVGLGCAFAGINQPQRGSQVVWSGDTRCPCRLNPLESQSAPACILEPLLVQVCCNNSPFNDIDTKTRKNMQKPQTQQQLSERARKHNRPCLFSPLQIHQKNP